jgi:hypothetical protein
MRDKCVVICFFEDIAQEKFIKAIVKRASQEVGKNVQVKVRSATRGSRVWNEFELYLKDIKRGLEPMPDILVVVIDSDCKGRNVVVNRIKQLAKGYGFPVDRVVCAVPEPHIERWYIEDQSALKRVISEVNVQKVGYKCERDRYKRALEDAIRKAGVEPLLGGAEYGDEIASCLDPGRLDKSFKEFWDELRRVLKNC